MQLGGILSSAEVTSWVRLCESCDAVGCEWAEAVDELRHSMIGGRWGLGLKGNKNERAYGRQGRGRSSDVCGWDSEQFEV